MLQLPVGDFLCLSVEITIHVKAVSSDYVGLLHGKNNCAVCVEEVRGMRYNLVEWRAQHGLVVLVAE